MQRYDSQWPVMQGLSRLLFCLVCGIGSGCSRSEMPSIQAVQYVRERLGEAEGAIRYADTNVAPEGLCGSYAFIPSPTLVRSATTELRVFQCGEYTIDYAADITASQPVEHGRWSLTNGALVLMPARRFLRASARKTHFYVLAEVLHSNQRWQVLIPLDTNVFRYTSVSGPEDVERLLHTVLVKRDRECPALSRE